MSKFPAIRIALEQCVSLVDPSFDVSIFRTYDTSVRQKIDEMLQRIEIDDGGHFRHLYTLYSLDLPVLTREEALKEYSLLPETEMFVKLKEQFMENDVDGFWIRSFYDQSDDQKAQTRRIIDIIGTFPNALVDIINDEL